MGAGRAHLGLEPISISLTQEFFSRIQFVHSFWRGGGWEWGARRGYRPACDYCVVVMRGSMREFEKKRAYSCDRGFTIQVHPSLYV